MAKNEILVKLVLNDDGTFSMVQQKAKKTAKAIETVTEATDKSNKRRNIYNKLEKGTAQLGMNSTKAFAKQAQTLGGTLVPAYATLAANIFALTAAFGALSRAARLEQLQEGLEFTGQVAGVNLRVISQSLREITGEAVSLRETMKTVALGTSAGFSTKQLEGLTTVAKGASLALGRDLSDALDRLTRGAAKLEPEILDELGIMVRLDDAVETYAAQIGKTASQLSQFERRQAFTNAIIVQGIEKFGALAESVDPNPYDKLSASFQQLSDSGLNMLNKVLIPIVDLLAESPTALLGVVSIFASTIINKIVPAANVAAKSFADASKNAAIQASIAAKKSEQAFKATARKIQSLDFAPKSVARIAPDLRAGLVVGQDLQKLIKNLKLSEELRNTALKRYAQDTTTAGKRILEQKTRELALVRQLRGEVEALATAEIRRGKASQGATSATVSKRVASRTSAYLTQIDKSGFFGGFKVAALGVSRNVKEISKATGVIGKLTNTIKVGSSALNLFGRAFLNIIPIVGQALFVWSLLQQFVLPLFNKKLSTSQKEMTRLQEITDSFNRSNERLEQTLGRNQGGWAGAFTATITTIAGQITQTRDQMDKVLTELELRANTAYQKALKKAEQIEALRQQGGAVGVWLADEGPVTAPDEKTFKDAQMASAEEAASVISAAKSLVNSVNENISKLGATKGAENFTEDLNRMRWTILPVIDILATLGENGEVTAGQLDKLKNAMGGASDSANEAKAPMDAFSTTLQKVQEFFAKLKVPKGEFADAITVLQDVQKNMGDTDASFKKYKAIFDEFGEFKSFAEFDAYVAKVVRLNTALDSTAVSIKEAKARAAELKAVGGLANILAGEELIRGTLQQRIDTITESLTLQIMDSQKRNKLEKERQQLLKDYADSLTRSRLAENKELRDIAKAEVDRLQNAKDLLEIQKSIAQELNKQGELTLEIAKVRDQAKNAGELGEGREKFYAIEAAKIKIQAAKTVLDLAIQGIAIERELAEAKLRLKEAEFNLDNVITEREQAVLDAMASVIKQQSYLNKEKVKTAQLELQLAKERLRLERHTPISSQSSVSSVTDLMEYFRQQALFRIKMEEKVAERVAELQEQQRKAGEEGRPFFMAGGTAEEQARLEVYGNASKTAQERLADFQMLSAATADSLKQFGPQGELVASVVEGASILATSWMNAFEVINSDSAKAADKAAAVFSGLAASVSALSGMMAAASQNRIAGIDAEIEAEKRRDGKSAESMAKIRALEKKKEAEKRKAFEQNKKMLLAQAVMSTAAAVANALATQPFLPMGPIMAGIAAVMGAAQIAVIKSMTYKGGSSDTPTQPSKISVGQRQNTVDLARSTSPAGELAYMRGERGMGTGANNYVPGGFAGKRMRAFGGNTGFMVGEQGPELFVPNRPGTIVPADDTEKAMAGPTNINFAISAIDAQGIEEVLMSQRGNIIGMIREAANEHGETFLERVSVYEPNTRQYGSR